MNKRNRTGAARVRAHLGLLALPALVLFAACLIAAQHAGWMPSLSAWDWLIGVSQASTWP